MDHHTRPGICPFIAWRALALQGARSGAASGWRLGWGEGAALRTQTDRGRSSWSDHCAQEKAGQELTVEQCLPGCLWSTWPKDLSIWGE